MSLSEKFLDTQKQGVADIMINRQSLEEIYQNAENDVANTKFISRSAFFT